MGDVGVGQLRDAEVGDLDLVGVVEDQVGRLDVAVDDAPRVRVVERRGHLAHEADHLLRLEARALGEHLRDGLAVDELHGEVGQPALLAQVEERDDPRVGERAGDLRLVVEALDEGAVLGARARDVEADGLDRERPLDQGVEGLVDGPHGAVAQAARDLVAAYGGGDLVGHLSSAVAHRSARRTIGADTLPPDDCSTGAASGVNARRAQVTVLRRACGYAILARISHAQSDAPAGRHHPLRSAPAAAEPPLSGLSRRAASARPHSCRRRASSSTPSPRPPRGRRGSSGPWRPWPRPWRASRRPEVRRRRRSGPGRSPRRERPPSSPASRPASSAGRCSSCGRRSRRWPWRGGSRRSAGTPVVPVFWVASDDHDFAEVRATTVVDACGALRTLRYDPHQEPLGRPAWDIVLDDTVGGLVDELARALPAALGRDETVGARGACYRPGETLSSAFARLVSRLLPELVVLDPADAALKRLMVPVLARELAEGSPTSRLALEAGRAPARGRLPPAGAGAPGLPEPVRDRRGPAPGARDLADGASRCAARAALVRGRGARAARARSRGRGARARCCGRWCRTRCCRPPPTSAGPAEIAYHAQIGPAYAHFGIPRPVLLPRPSLTLVEPPQARALEAEQLTLGDLAGDPERLVARWAREAYPDVEAAFARTREAIERELGAVEAALGRARPDAARRRGRRPAGARCTRSRACTRRRCARSRSATRAAASACAARATRCCRAGRCRSAGSACRPRGRHGRAIVPALEERLAPFARGHQVVLL